VLEAFLTTGETLPPVRVTRTRPIDRVEPDPVSGARVVLTVDGTDIAYEESGEPGTYRPSAPFDSALVRAWSAFTLVVVTDADRAEASGVTPPALDDMELTVTVPEAPVEAVLLDSLSLPLDSLQFEIPSRTGYVYPIVASISWPSGGPEWWMATRLEPRVPFSSELLEYFLRPSSVVDESRFPTGGATWDGVYAVPVDGPGDPVPPHDLVVTLVRGNTDWAAYAASADDPARRAPVSNVEGGIGVVVGVYVLRRTLSLP